MPLALAATRRIRLFADPVLDGAKEIQHVFT
jgi:hypothetical protein